MWIDKFDDTGEDIIYTEIKCDYCGAIEMWFNASINYEIQTEKIIKNDKRLNGWASIDIYTYNNKERCLDTSNPDNEFHACPDCRKNKLKITNEPLYVSKNNNKK